MKFSVAVSVFFLVATFGSAETLTGTVKNGTTNKPAAGDDVVLIKLAHAAQRAIESLTQFARLIRANLMHRRPLNQLRSPAHSPETAPIHCRTQTTLVWP